MDDPGSIVASLDTAYKEAVSWDERKRPSGRWISRGQDERRARGNPAECHIKKADRLPAKVLKEKATDANASSLSFGELSVVDSLRNFLTAPSEEIMGTLTTMQDGVDQIMVFFHQHQLK